MRCKLYKCIEFMQIITLLLNQARTGQLGLFLMSANVCMFMCVCLPLRLLITSGVI